MPPPPRLLDRLRDAIRVRHYAIRTESAHVDWVRRFILFHGKRHPQDMGPAQVAAFPTHSVQGSGLNTVSLDKERPITRSGDHSPAGLCLFFGRGVGGGAADGVKSAGTRVRAVRSCGL